MAKASVFIADGFEEIEALTAVDLLRRGGVEVDTVSVGEGLSRTGAHDVAVRCDRVFADTDWAGSDMLVLPGGWPGAENLRKTPQLCEKLVAFEKEGRWVAAICAAPYVLGELGLLKGRKATCYPGFEKALVGATVTGGRVERDGCVITGRGPGVATDFALELVEALAGKEKAAEVREGLVG